MGTYRKSKSDKKAAQRKAGKAAPDHRTRNILLIVGGLVVVGVMGWLLWLAMRPTQELAGVVTFPRPSQGHELDLEIPFGELPPAGGTHDPAWQTCGIYDQPLNTANVVHSLEHGAIWISYQTDLPAEEVAAIHDAIRGQTYLVVSPLSAAAQPDCADRLGGATGTGERGRRPLRAVHRALPPRPDDPGARRGLHEWNRGADRVSERGVTPPPPTPSPSADRPHLAAPQTPAAPGRRRRRTNWCSSWAHRWPAGLRRRATWRC